MTDGEIIEASDKRRDIDQTIEHWRKLGLLPGEVWMAMLGEYRRNIDWDEVRGFMYGYSGA